MPDALYEVRIGGGVADHERNVQQMVGAWNGHGANNAEYAVPFKPVYNGAGYLIDGVRQAAGGSLRLTSNGVNHLTLTTGAASSALVWTIAGLTSTGNVQINGTLGVTGAAAFNGNVTLGDAAGDTITVNGTATFNQPTTLNGITVTGAALFTSAVTMNGNVTLGDASSDTLTVNATSTFNASISGTSLALSSTLTVDGNTVLGNGNTDTLTVVGVTTFRNATNTATQLFVDAANNRVIVGSSTALGSDTTPALHVIGRLYVAPESANDTALQIRRSSAATVGWTVGVENSPVNLAFKDDSGTKVFALGDAAHTYQAMVTGDFHVSDDSLLEGDVMMMSWATIGTNVRAGLETLRVNGQTRMDNALTVVAGGISVTGSSVFNSAVSIVSGGISVIGGISTNAGGGELILGTNVLTSTAAAGGSATAVPSQPALYFYVRVNGTLYRVPAFN